MKFHWQLHCSYLFPGTVHQLKSGGAEIGVPEKVLRGQKMPLLENTRLFLLNFYKQSGSKKLLITIKRLIKHQGNKVRK